MAKYTDVRSKVVVLFLSINCLMLLPLFVGGSMLSICFALQYVVSFLVLQSFDEEGRASCIT